MRITDIASLAVDAGDRDWVFVRVDTDEPGLVGWGEASLGWYPNAVRGAVRRNNGQFERNLQHFQDLGSSFHYFQIRLAAHNYANYRRIFRSLWVSSFSHIRL